MAHEYSVQIHEWINDRLEKVQADIKQSADDASGNKKTYFLGQKDQLNDIRQFLTDHIDLDTHNYY